MASNGLFGDDIVVAGWYDLTSAGWFDESLIGPPASGGSTVALSAVGITTAAVTLNAPALGQRHVLIAVGAQTFAPTLGAPVLRQAHALLATGLATDAPVLAAAAFAQRHALAGIGLATAAADLGSPAIGSAGTVDLLADKIDAGAPTLGAPAVAENAGPAPVEEAPRRGMSVFIPAHVITRPVVLHALATERITTQPPTLGRPSFVAGRSRLQVQRRRAMAALVC